MLTLQFRFIVNQFLFDNLNNNNDNKNPNQRYTWSVNILKIIITATIVEFWQNKSLYLYIFWVKFTVKTEFDNLVGEWAKKHVEQIYESAKCCTFYVRVESVKNVSDNVTYIFIFYLYDCRPAWQPNVYIHISCSFIILYKIIFTLSSLCQLLRSLGIQIPICNS